MWDCCLRPDHQDSFTEAEPSRRLVRTDGTNSDDRWNETRTCSTVAHLRQTNIRALYSRLPGPQQLAGWNMTDRFFKLSGRSAEGSDSTTCGLLVRRLESSSSAARVSWHQLCKQDEFAHIRGPHGR